MFRVLEGVLLVAFVASIGTVSRAQSLYIAEVNLLDEGYVRTMAVDGSQFETLYETTGGLRGLELVPSLNRAYLTDVDTGAVQRAVLNTFGDVETVVTGLVFPQDLAASVRRDSLAWTDPGTETIGLASLDGGHHRLLVSDIVSTSVAMDQRGDWVYFEDRATSSRGAIRRVRLDGTGLQTILNDVPTASDIAIDSAHGYVYWGSSAGFDGIGGIYRARFDGTQFEEIFRPDDSRLDATSLALDTVNGYLYTGVRNGGAGTTEIWRMGLGGEGPVFIRGGFELITDISYLVPAPGAVAPLALAGLLASRRRR